MSNLKFHKATVWESALRIGISLLCGGIFYTFWLVAFLLMVPEGGIIEAIFWITAPLVTGLGFGVGTYLTNKILKMYAVPFLRIILWPLIGCVLGAVAVFWFGPMLIVFSMLIAGTASVTLQEFYLYWRRSA